MFGNPTVEKKRNLFGQSCARLTGPAVKNFEIYHNVEVIFYLTVLERKVGIFNANFCDVAKIFGNKP